jgi:hypothetical protein
MTRNHGGLVLLIILASALIAIIVYWSVNGSSRIGPPAASATDFGIDISQAGTPIVLNTPEINFTGNATVTAAGVNIAGGGAVPTATPITVFYHTIEDEDVALTQFRILNFTGAGVTCANGASQTDCTITGGGGGGHTIKDEGTPQPARTGLNFVGAGVTCADDAGNDETDCTIPGDLGAESLADTLVAGSVTGGTNLTISTGDDFICNEDCILENGSITLSQAGEVGIDTTGAWWETLNYHDGSQERILSPVGLFGATLTNPTAGDELTIFYHRNDRPALTVIGLCAVIQGSSTPSVTYTIRHATSRAAGTEIDTGGDVITSVTTADCAISGFEDATIPSNSWVWLDIAAQSGTVTEIAVTGYYTLDN